MFLLALPLYAENEALLVTAVVKDESAQDIYQALDVKSVRETDITDVEQQRKRVGPLTCRKTTLFSLPRRESTIHYLCELVSENASEHSEENVASVSGEDARVIYEALQVTEEYVRDPISTFVKRVGTLQCSKSRLLGTENFFCSLKE